MTHGAKVDKPLSTGDAPQLSQATFVRPSPVAAPNSSPNTTEPGLSLTGTSIGPALKATVLQSKRASSGFLGSNIFEKRRGGIAASRSIFDKLIDVVVRVLKFLEQKIFGRASEKAAPAPKKQLVKIIPPPTKEKEPKALTQEKRLNATPIRRANR